MRRYIVIVIILVCAVFGLASCSDTEDAARTEVTLYYVDAQMNRLIPYKGEICEGTPKSMAQSAVRELIEGRSYNDKIRRLLPDRLSCMVKGVKDGVAYVDLSSSAAQSLPDSRDIENLVIYQIVNTLTGIDGIRFVRFTVDGRTSRDFMGYYDMRETYKYNYPE